MATTAPRVELVESEWRVISSSQMHSMQCRAGNALIIYGDTQPTVSVASDDMAHSLIPGQWFVNSTGGTAWGRAVGAKSYISVTED